MSKRVDVLILTYRHLIAQSYNAILTTLNYTREQGVSVKVPAVFSGGLIHFARNDSLKHVRKNADFVLFCDDDMMPEPDSLCKLMAHDLPVISALTTTRGLPVKLNVKAYDRKLDKFGIIDAIRPNALVTGDIAAGTGFLLVKREVIDSVREFYLSAEDWLMDNKEMLDRLGMPHDVRVTERLRRSAARRRLAADTGIERLFHYHRGENEDELGEDISFCRRILQLGIPISVDTSVQVGHIGDYAFGPWNLEEDDDDSRTDSPGPVEAASADVTPEPVTAA